MSLLTAGQLAQDGEFILRVKIAMISAAKDISASTETTFKEYEKRFEYAVSILNNPDNKVSAFTFAVAANPAITKESDDGAIQFTINSVFNAFAGVKPSDATKDTTTAEPPKSVTL